MKNLRTYGQAPFDLAVIHGGPGAAGGMAPVARELSSRKGVLEPFQTATTVDGQIRELKDILQKNGNPPLILIGWSWGAWLSFAFAAQYPALVKKVILIGSGPFEDTYARNITKTRMSRLNGEDRAEALSLMESFKDASLKKKNTLLARFGELISRADAYDPLPHTSEILECRYEIYQSVWEQASRLRSSGQLLEMGKKIRCPVVSIHGDYDPHPFEGIRRPLARILKDFRFILLENCGHQPWIEKHAKNKFYDILKSEIEE